MALELKGVRKVVEGQVHIHPTDLRLEQGSMNVLLGPTSSGKTSLMRLMAGLDVPGEGEVWWNGENVTGMRVQDRKVAMVYQQFINYPSMSVYDNIASPMRLMGVSKTEIDARVRETAELMKLTPMLERKPLELSGGQQQRCALARALVKNAGLVLLDEPLANLDYKLREELRVEIPRIFEASGAIFVYATSLTSVSMILAAGLSFLGLGVKPPEPEWGLMLNTLRTAIYIDPVLAALPGAMIFLTSLCLNLLSDGLRSAMNIKD